MVVQLLRTFAFHLKEIVNGTQRFLALQNSKPEARLSIAVTAVQHITLAFMIKNEWVFDHLGVPAVRRYIYSCFV